MRGGALEDRDPVPTFGGGDRAKMTPGIIPERSMAPSVGSSQKNTLRVWASMAVRVGGEADPGTVGGPHGWWRLREAHSSCRMGICEPRFPLSRASLGVLSKVLALAQMWQ